MKDYKKLLKGIEPEIFFDWYFFGDKTFKCPHKVDNKRINFFKENKSLPKPCDKCYKALIFWNYSPENVINFLKMIDSFDFKIKGKLNDGVVVFYFRKKKKMLHFIEQLKNKMIKFNVVGKIQWRRACREYQKRIPQYWKNAKQFVWEK